MEREDVKVRPGHEFDKYFPPAKLQTISIKKGANVEDTMRFIPDLVRETAHQTKRFSLEVIRAPTLEETCRRLWNFVFTYIAYKKDEDGKEQVRDPARTWHDRHQGVDCDCMTVFCASVLFNLKIKNVTYRIARYKKSNFEHIYSTVQLIVGGQIIIDPVLFHFNREADYNEIKDYPMDLEYLNGIPDPMKLRLTDAAELSGLMGDEEALNTLGRILKRKQASGNNSAAPSKEKKGFFHKRNKEEKQQHRALVKQKIGKGLHVTNRLNPVTVALRNGVLAGMKLNFLQIASNLRWTYLSREDAQSQGGLMDRYDRMLSIREKLEKIFYGAGGKPENLKKAILEGRGNQDKAVPLNGPVQMSAEEMDGLHQDMPLDQLLGLQIYRSENVEGMLGVAGLQGFNGGGDLGAATAASVAAATSALTVIAGMIKEVGSIFPKRQAKPAKPAKTKKASQNKNSAGTPAADDRGANSAQAPEDNAASQHPTDNRGENSAQARGTSGSEGESNPGAVSDGKDANGSDPVTTEPKDQAKKSSGGLMDKARSFWENNKGWAMPASMVVGALALGGGLWAWLGRKPKKQGTGAPLAGLRSAKNTKIKAKEKKGSGKTLLNGIHNKKKNGMAPAHKAKKKHKHKLKLL